MQSLREPANSSDYETFPDYGNVKLLVCVAKEKFHNRQVWTIRQTSVQCCSNVGSIASPTLEHKNSSDKGTVKK